MTLLKPMTLGAIAAATFNTATGTTTLSYDGLLTPAFGPAGQGPWANVTASTLASRLDGNGEPFDIIKLDITANLQSAEEFITKFGVSLPDYIDPSTLHVFSVNTTGFNDVKSVDFSRNTFNTGAGTEVGLLVEFDASNKQDGVNRFNGSDSVSLVVEYYGDVPISAETFLTDETFGTAHVQGIDGVNSTWVANIPEPSSALLTSLAALGLLRRKR